MAETVDYPRPPVLLGPTPRSAILSDNARRGALVLPFGFVIVLAATIFTPPALKFLRFGLASLCAPTHGWPLPKSLRCIQVAAA
ncbi:MAG TPA: hypothetical protein VKB47_15545 [Terracidiphilus sp.]|nr:hypothetical protein [Terracidiphilus sp.]